MQIYHKNNFLCAYSRCYKDARCYSRCYSRCYMCFMSTLGSGCNLLTWQTIWVQMSREEDIPLGLICFMLSFNHSQWDKLMKIWMQASEQNINEDSVSLFICADTQHSTVHKGFLMLICTLEMNTLWILQMEKDL